MLLPWGRFEVVWQSDKEMMVQEWIEKTNPKATDYDDALFSLKAQLSEVNTAFLNFIIVVKSHIFQNSYYKYL